MIAMDGKGVIRRSNSHDGILKKYRGVGANEYGDVEHVACR